MTKTALGFADDDGPEQPRSVVWPLATTTATNCAVSGVSTTLLDLHPDRDAHFATTNLTWTWTP